ncbi:unnamed protein product [Pleuronectes platessa]|uniref:Uncharacterized protein n=1 Tax=Pleuronectes platessa TaxID=8262 RepID=A0A9N7Y2G3_PLEPL|nr:unnamed protein product [Pleuronectes platessa]
MAWRVAGGQGGGDHDRGGGPLQGDSWRAVGCLVESFLLSSPGSAGGFSQGGVQIFILLVVVEMFSLITGHRATDVGVSKDSLSLAGRCGASALALCMAELVAARSNNRRAESVTDTSADSWKTTLTCGSRKAKPRLQELDSHAEKSPSLRWRQMCPDRFLSHSKDCTLADGKGVRTGEDSREGPPGY